MKTIKTLFLTLMLAVLSLSSFSIDYNESRYEIKTENNLKTVIKRMVTKDFYRTDNYFHNNNIPDLKEVVVVKFLINSDNKIQVIEIDSKSPEAKEYINGLLHNSKVKANGLILNKYYKIEIKLDYQS